MPRFFTHIRHGANFVEDQEGKEFSTLEGALRDAVVAAREVMASRVLSGQRSNSSTIEIMDEAGKLVRSIRFADVLDHD